MLPRAPAQLATLREFDEVHRVRALDLGKILSEPVAEQFALRVRDLQQQRPASLG